MDRRQLLLGAGALMAVPTAPSLARIRTSDPASLKGQFLDLATPEGNRDAWARLLANTDMKSTKYGWAQGIVQGVMPGEAVRDVCGFTMLSCAKLLPLEGTPGGYRKVLREIGLYTDLASGEIIEEMMNPWLNERVKVVPITNDPFNHTTTQFAPEPPSYGGLNAAKPPKKPLMMNWTRRGPTLNLFSYINLFYPSALQPAKWPRENGNAFNQVTETFLYQIPWADMQNAKKTSVEYNGTWSRTTPWLPWWLMGPTPGHAVYNTFMGSYDDINRVDRKTLDYVQKNYPKYMSAPDKWEEPSLSSLEWYARTQTAAAVPAGQPVPRAPEPQVPAWFKAMQAGRGG